MRKAAKLDEHDLSEDMIVEVNVPEDVFSINSSFFLGLFGESIRKLGEEGFRKRYQFVGKNIERVIDSGIEDALRTESPL